MKADEYRQYAVECWRLAWQEEKNRDYWMMRSGQWMVLAAFAARAEGRSSARPSG
jgi:hypothetical protein